MSTELQDMGVPDFNDPEWEAMRVKLQAQLVVAALALSEHAGNPEMMRIPFEGFSVTISATPKRVTQ